MATELLESIADSIDKLKVSEIEQLTGMLGWSALYQILASVPEHDWGCGESVRIEVWHDNDCEVFTNRE